MQDIPLFPLTLFSFRHHHLQEALSYFPLSQTQDQTQGAFSLYPVIFGGREKAAAEKVLSPKGRFLLERCGK